MVQLRAEKVDEIVSVLGHSKFIPTRQNYLTYPLCKNTWKINRSNQSSRSLATESSRMIVHHANPLRKSENRGLNLKDDSTGNYRGWFIIVGARGGGFQN